MSVDQIVDDFNSTLSDLISNLADVCPDNIISDNRDLIKKMLSRNENKRKAIDVFVAKVLIYKSEIDNGDESFFLNKSYNNDIGDVDNGSSITNKIFEFKNIWVKLSHENKQFVIQYMQLLCLLAQNYFLILDSSN